MSTCGTQHATCIREATRGNEYLYPWIQVPNGVPYEYPSQVLTGPGTRGMPCREDIPIYLFTKKGLKFVHNIREYHANDS